MYVIIASIPPTPHPTLFIFIYFFFVQPLKYKNPLSGYLESSLSEHCEISDSYLALLMLLA